jgi:citrate lyase subunit beta/citryl-CoA lyase
MIRLTRTMLFVPAVRRPMIEKAASSAADAVCIDLEDSVPPDLKDAGRDNAIRALRELDFGHRVRLLRVNALDTVWALRDLTAVVEAAGDRIDLIMLPKAGRPRDVEFVETLLDLIGARHIGIEAQIESASGFLYAREIAQCSPRLEALIFGPGDYSASLRMPASSIGELDANDDLYPGHRWHAVMHTIVAVARANGLRAIDGPFAALKDAAGLERVAGIARALGFDGKQCIHPAQLDSVNRIFSPSAEEIAHAERIVQAYDLAAANGRGAVSLDGRMIDAANLRMAQVVLERKKLSERSASH